MNKMDTMKKVKYFYNTHKLKFEKIETPLRVRLLQAFGFTDLEKLARLKDKF